MSCGSQYWSVFFSSRRRHTRFDCDWSSDVCCSDLFCCCWGARRTTVVSMLTRVSLGAAWRVAYTTPPIIAVWITSDVKPTRSPPWLRVFRLNSRSEKTTDPPPVRRLSTIVWPHPGRRVVGRRPPVFQDRKSTRLNSSHSQISYAVFCLKKKNK